MPQQEGAVRSAHRINRTYIVTLAAIAAGILVVGSQFRPRQATTDVPVPGPSQAELSRLMRLSQRRSLDSMSEYFGTLARDLESSVVNLPSLDRTGLMWETELVLTARTEPQFPSAATLATPEGNVGVITMARGPDLPIAGLRTSAIEGLRPPRRRAAAELDSGAWILALWRRGRELGFGPAHFLGISSVSCGRHTVSELVSNVVWTPEMVGGGVFDLDEGLVAIIVRCGPRLAAVTIEGIVSLLREGQSLEGRLVGRYGFRIEELTRPEQDFFSHPGGFLVREVWTGSFADRGGFRPGDIIVAIDGLPVESADQLEPVAALIQVDAFDFTVLRDGELRELRLTTGMGDPAPPPQTDGILWARPSVGVLIDSVAPDSRGYEAGVRGGDRLLRIDGVAIDSGEQVADVLSPDRERPVFVELGRANHRRGLLLP